MTGKGGERPKHCFFGVDDGNIECLDCFRILDEIHEGVYITDAKANTLYVNHAYEQISGAQREMFIGKNMRTVVEEGLIDESASIRVIEQGKEVTMNQVLKSGKTALITGTPVFVDGVLKLVVTIVRDITELNEVRRQLDESTRAADRLRFIVGDGQEIVFRSVSMKSVLAKVEMVSKYDTTVLITGETGVGKDLVAKYVHKLGNRSEKPFIEVNCSAIPSTLIESEFFGYEKGSFTGASAQGKKGVFEMADGGTIFLDEIGELPLDMQSKLLRVLQNKSFRRIGGETGVTVDVQVIAATNRNLKEMVKEHRFREDLYYRLNVIPLYIPPLRDRSEDIVCLANHFL